MSSVKNAMIRDKSFYQAVISIMIPVALQQAINVGVNMMDTLMLGSFGEIQLSASSLANEYYHFYNILCLGIIGGSSVLTAQYWGSRDLKRARQSISLAVQFGFVIAAVFAVLTFLFPRQIMQIYSSEEAVIEQGIRYLNITAFIFIIHGTSFIAAQLMRSVRQPRLGLYVSIVSFFVNVIANYVFIFGKFGAPRMEIAGAALGTLIARVVEFCITFGYILFVDKKLGLRVRDLFTPPEAASIRAYFRLGAPVLVSDSLLGLGTTSISVVLGHMGAAVVASNAICRVIDRIFTTVIQGTSNAASIITGNTIGQGDRERAMQQGESFYFLGIFFGVIAAVLTLVVGPLSLRLYTLAPETLVIARQMMLAYGVIVFFQSLQSVMTKGVLRGGGDTRFLMKADILFMWLVSLPLGAVGGLLLHWPGWLTMMALRADFAIKSIWCVGRLHSGKWIHVADGIQLKQK